MKIKIGAYEAKTKLPELLRQVRAGKRFTITNRGKAIADLVPSEGAPVKNATAAIERFLAFKRHNPIRGKVDIKALIKAGRDDVCPRRLGHNVMAPQGHGSTRGGLPFCGIEQLRSRRHGGGCTADLGS